MTIMKKTTTRIFLSYVTLNRIVLYHKSETVKEVKTKGSVN